VGTTRETAVSILTGTSVRWLEALLVALVVLLLYLPTLEEVEFHGDESQWISTSRYFEHFLSGDYESAVWRVHYWTLTQPPVVRYTIGISRRLAGFGTPDLNKPYRFRNRPSENVRRGRVPSPDLLYWSRFPMVIQSAAAFGIVIFLVAHAAGRLAAYLSVLLLVLNPYFALHLRRAMGEATVLFWGLMTALIAFLVLRRLRRGGLSTIGLLLGSAAAGVTAGLAGASKLNGLSAIGVGAAIAVGILLSPTQKSWRGAVSLAAVVIAACGAFVLVNPFLYPAPMERTKAMFENRVREMNGQVKRNPEDNQVPLDRRVRIVPKRVFRTHSPWRFPGGGVVNALLGLIGVLWLASRLRRLWREPEGGEACLVLLASSVALSSPILLLPLDWERYYVFPVVFSTAFTALALAVGTTRLMQTRE
jgi:hypothetical protein